MPTTKYDYDTLERQFVQGTMSVRQLAADHGIKTFSTVYDRAEKDKWLEKRAEFQERLRDKEIEAVTTKRADELAKALDDAVTIAGQAQFAFLDSLKDRWSTDPETGERRFIPGQLIVAGDFVKIMEKLMVLNGQVTSREAHLGLNVDATPSMEMLRDLANAARAAGANARPAPTSPLPRSDGASEVH